MNKKSSFHRLRLLILFGLIALVFSGCATAPDASGVPLPKVSVEAGAYLAMNRNRFNAEVRPHLTEIPIGRRGIAFDRLELDAWADQYMARNGRPAQQNVQTRPPSPSRFPRTGAHGQLAAPLAHRPRVAAARLQ